MNKTNFTPQVYRKPIPHAHRKHPPTPKPVFSGYKPWIERNIEKYFKDLAQNQPYKKIKAKKINEKKCQSLQRESLKKNNHFRAIDNREIPSSVKDIEPSLFEIPRVLVVKIMQLVSTNDLLNLRMTCKAGNNFVAKCLETKDNHWRYLGRPSHISSLEYIRRLFLDINTLIERGFLDKSARIILPPKIDAPKTLELLVWKNRSKKAKDNIVEFLQFLELIGFLNKKICVYQLPRIDVVKTVNRLKSLGWKSEALQLDHKAVKFLELLQKSGLLQKDCCSYFPKEVNKIKTLKSLKSLGWVNKTSNSKEMLLEIIELFEFKNIFNENCCVYEPKKIVNIDQTVKNLLKINIETVSSIYNNTNPGDVLNTFMLNLYSEKIKRLNEFNQMAIFTAYNKQNILSLRFLNFINANFDHQDREGFTVLTRAINEKRFGIAEEILKLPGMTVHARHKNGSFPIHFAAQQGWNEGIKILLEKGACIDEKRLDGDKPIDFAIRKGHLETIEFLLENKADPNIFDSLDLDRKGIWLELLLRYGASPESNYSGSPLLHAAVRQDNVAWIDLLHKYKAKIDVKDHEGWAPLMLAVCVDSLSLVEKLLYLDANPNIETPGGEALILFAINCKSLDIAEKLIEFGADPKVLGTNGETALCLAAKVSDSEEFMQLLLDKEVDINQAGNDGSPVYLAFKAGLNENVRWLLEHGADLKGLSFQEK